MKKTKNLVLLAVFSALIVLMTVVPFTGYISYGAIEITTLHIVVILCAILLGVRSGAIIGGVWGLTCIARAAVFAASSPVFEIFLNPLVSFVPRVLVGVVAAAVFALLKNKARLGDTAAAVISAICGTLTNTVLVLTAMFFLGDSYKGFQDISALLKNIWLTMIGINGIIELLCAVIVVPAVYRVLSKFTDR